MGQTTPWRTGAHLTGRPSPVLTTLCFNPRCPQPLNSDAATTCEACGQLLLLNERYRCQGLLGQGGFGRTYQAIDESIPPAAPCVVKQILPDSGGAQSRSAIAALAPEEQHRRFRLEVQQLDRLGKHPQIPRLLDVIENDLGQFLVQDYVPGPNLDQLAEQQVVDETLVRRVLDELLPVLQFVHDHQVIHRDIKPANIIAPPQPQPFALVDFGASKYIYDQALLEKTGTVIGSAGYVAPEQALGKAVYASDIFSLGVTCLHLLTGMHPFDLYSVSDDTWAWKPFVQTPVNKRLARVLDRMVSRRLKERYSSAQEVMADLRWMLVAKDRAKPASTLINSPSPGAKPQKPDQVWELRYAVGIPGVIENAVSICPSGREMATAGSDGAVRLWDCTNGELLHSFTKPLKVFGVGHQGQATAIVFSGDSQFLFSGGTDSQVIRWDLTDYRNSRRLPGLGWATSALLLSPDGKTLVAAAEDGRIYLWDLDQQGAVRSLVHHQDRVTALTFDPQAQQLISGSWDHTIRLWSFPSGRLAQTITTPQEKVLALACHPQDGRIVSGDGAGRVQVWQPQRPNVGLLLTALAHPITALAISPNGHWLAIGGEDGSLMLWDLQSQTRTSLFRHDWAVRSLAFTPDSRMLVSTGAEETIRFWCRKR
jgi:serine/threonine protein kinase